MIVKQHATLQKHEKGGAVVPPFTSPQNKADSAALRAESATRIALLRVARYICERSKPN